VTTDRTRRAFDLREAIGLLARTPATFDAMLRGLPEAWMRAHEGGETWSPFDIVGHMVHAEKTDWMPRARMILEHGDSRPFEPFDRFAQFRETDQRTLESLLDEFAALRRDNIAALEGFALTRADLEKPGRHPALGTVTLSNLLATWVAHDFDHVMQVSRVLARQYTDAVGPWSQYLRVISGQPG